MRRRWASTTTLVALAEGQWGLFTTAQAARLGVDRTTLLRLVADQIVERLAHGVYRVRGSAPVDHVDLRAAWLLLDPGRLAEDRLRDVDAVVSHYSAARLLRLGDLPADRHEFTLPVRRQSRRSDVRLHRRAFAGPDWTIVDGLPVTVARRTITDLLAERVDGGHLATIVADALRQQQIEVSALREILAPYAARYGLLAGDGAAFLDYLQELTGASPQQLVDELADRLSALVGVGGPAGTRDAAQAISAVAGALPPLPIEAIQALDAMREASEATAAIRNLVPAGSRRAFQEQATTIRRALNSPAMRALQRDRVLWARLAEQADLLRRAGAKARTP